jgi:hypothetical protein
MVEIVIGATGEYSVIDHTAVEQCGCERCWIWRGRRRIQELVSDAVLEGIGRV